MNDFGGLLQKDHYDAEDLRAIVRILRSPEGCPWDRVQTHESIRSNFIEEVYETADAIDRDDADGMREELGDVLFQIVFHAQLEEEKGRFGMPDVIDGICRKMITRHPHVFGQQTVDENGTVLKDWEAIKANSHAHKTATDVLNAIPQTLPALMRADKLGEKSRKAGFDHLQTEDALAKVDEELGEVRDALAAGEKPERLEEEFGDLLLAVSCAARIAGVRSEQALFRACEKYLARFALMEEQCLQAGCGIADTPRERLLEYWRNAKKLKKRHKNHENTVANGKKV